VATTVVTREARVSRFVELEAVSLVLGRLVDGGSIITFNSDNLDLGFVEGDYAHALHRKLWPDPEGDASGSELKADGRARVLAARFLLEIAADPDELRRIADGLLERAAGRFTTQGDGDA
jgi:hypothetical protein